MRTMRSVHVIFGKKEAANEDAEDGPNAPSNGHQQQKKSDRPVAIGGEGQDDADEDDDAEGDSDQEDSDESDDSEPLALEEEESFQISSDEEAELEKQRIDFHELLAKRLSLDNASVRSGSASGASLNTSRNVSPTLSGTSSRSNSVARNLPNLINRPITTRLRSRRCSSASTNSSIKTTSTTSTTTTATGRKTKAKSLTKPKQIIDNLQKLPSKPLEDESLKKSSVRSRTASRSSENSNSSQASMAEGCGCILIYGNENKIIYNCGLCDLRYDVMETFAKHLFTSHQLIDEDFIENNPNDLNIKEDLNRINGDGGEKAPLSSVKQTLCGNIFVLERQSLFVKCDYCNGRYSNLEIFKTHLKQNHKLLKTPPPSPSLSPKLLASADTEPTEKKKPSLEPLLVTLNLKKEIKSEFGTSLEDDNQSREVSPISNVSSPLSEIPMVVIFQPLSTKEPQDKENESQQSSANLGKATPPIADSMVVPSILDSPQSPEDLNFPANEQINESGNKENEANPKAVSPQPIVMVAVPLKDLKTGEDETLSLPKTLTSSPSQQTDFNREKDSEFLDKKSERLDWPVPVLEILPKQEILENNEEDLNIPEETLPSFSSQPAPESEDLEKLKEKVTSSSSSSSTTTTTTSISKKRGRGRPKKEKVPSITPVLPKKRPRKGKENGLTKTPVKENGSISSSQTTLPEHFLISPKLSQSSSLSQESEENLSTSQKDKRKAKTQSKEKPDLNRSTTNGYQGSSSQTSISGFLISYNNQVSSIQDTQKPPTNESVSPNSKDQQEDQEVKDIKMEENSTPVDTNCEEDQEEDPHLLQDKENLNQNVMDSIKIVNLSQENALEKEKDLMKEASSVPSTAEDEEVTLISSHIGENLNDSSSSKEEKQSPEISDETNTFQSMVASVFNNEKLPASETNEIASTVSSSSSATPSPTPAPPAPSPPSTAPTKKQRGRKSTHHEFVCDYCKKVFDKHSRFIEHVRLHTGEKPFRCDVCNREFRLKKSLTEHSMRHLEERAFKCEICGLGLATKQDLTQHLRHHIGDRRSKCSQCPKAFVRRSDLKIHERVHTGEKPFVCEICKKSFRANQNLIVHRRSHTMEKNFACEVCDKRFLRKVDRKVHMRTHTGERPFKCDICNRGFSSRAHAKAHKAREHNELDDKKERKKASVKVQQLLPKTSKKSVSNDEPKEAIEKPAKRKRSEKKKTQKQKILEKENPLVIKKTRKRKNSKEADDSIDTGSSIETNGCENPERLRKPKISKKSFDSFQPSTNSQSNSMVLSPAPQVSVTVSMQVEKVRGGTLVDSNDLAGDDDDIHEVMPEKENDTSLLTASGIPVTSSVVSSSSGNLASLKEAV